MRDRELGKDGKDAELREGRLGGDGGTEEGVRSNVGKDGKVWKDKGWMEGKKRGRDGRYAKGN